MLKNSDIVCISSIDWDFIWQGHQEIMTRLARGGNRVLFVENTGVRVPALRDIGRIKKRIMNWRKGLHGIRKIEEGLYVYSPIVLPFPYLKIARYINKKIVLSVMLKWLKAVGFSKPIVWTFLPTGLSLDIINEIEPRVLIYYCIDSFQASSRDARKIRRTEEATFRKADVVFATSQNLFDYCSRYNRKVHCFPFGVNIDSFTGIIDKSGTMPKDIESVKGPIAGYVGGIHQWIDFDLLKEAASKNKEVSFVFCGPIQTDISKVKDMPNIIFLGQKSPGELPAYVKEFDLSLIPYRVTEYTKNVYPTKLNEYLSLGKPVVSTNLPEIMRFNKENGNIVRVAATPEEFSACVRDVLKNLPTGESKALLMKAAEKNSWRDRLEKMSSLIEDIIREKAKEREVSWRANVIRIYKKTKNGLLPLFIAAAVIYLILFHTPVIWILAEPLSISDRPHSSDAVVALGGGVGESGKVAQGYEERVDSAVRLYREGLAKKIVYSSGYRYIMKEAQVMKALSVFMGIKKDDIILDEASLNTYEMVIHLKELAGNSGWKDLMIVSSPYHMRRLKLLCDKHLKGVNIYYIPVAQSGFYSHNSSIKLSQIKGILQEYAAILYYKLKGYL